MQYASLLRQYGLALFFVAVFLLALGIWQIFDLPSDQELVTIIEQYFIAYGPTIVLVGAFLETLLMVGWYVPGGSVVFLGVVFASGGDPTRAIFTILLAAIGVFAGYGANYILGRYGWARLFTHFGMGESLIHAKRRIERHSFIALLASYWQPGLGSITSTAAGMIHQPPRTFFAYSAVAVAFWAAFWGSIAFFFGRLVIDAVGLRLVFLAVVVWVVVVLILQATRDGKEG